jgi:hypothetical protein
MKIEQQLAAVTFGTSRSDDQFIVGSKQLLSRTHSSKLD